MTNIFSRPEKGQMKEKLFQIAVQALEQDGWTVERVPGGGKASLRRISKGSKKKLVSIRTTQDTWIAFPRTSDDRNWLTLADVDAVVAASVDDHHNPKFAKVHIIDGDEMRDRFDRSYKARLKAGHTIPIGRGMWVSLYNSEANDPPSLVGAGAGLKNPPIATVALTSSGPAPKEAMASDEPLSIAEAKRRLAITLGVDPSSIKISVEA
jgi:hypothetical protein